MTCTHCGTDNKSEYRFCANCGEKLVAQQPDEGIRGNRARAVTTAPQKPVGLAIASFFIPGLGHFMQGNTKKAGLLFGGAIVLILTGIGYFLVGVYAAYDIYNQGTS